MHISICVTSAYGTHGAYGVYMVRIWCVYGVYVVHMWCVYGAYDAYMVHTKIWNVFKYIPVEYTAQG
jgi:Na+/H+-dicarboxylate symporter